MKTNREIIRRLMHYVRPHWQRVLLAIAGMVVVAVTEPAVAALMQPLIDGTFIDRDPQARVLVPLALVGLFLARGIGRVVATLGVTAVATQVVMRLRLDLFRHLQLLPQAFMDQHTSGRLLSRVTYDVEQLSATASKVWLVLVRDSLVVLGLLGYLFYLNWQLTLLVLLTAPVIALIIKVVSKRLRKSSRILQENMGHLTHRLEENLKGHRQVKLFGAERQEEGRFFAVVNYLRQTTLKLTVLGAANSPVVQLVIAMALAAVIYIAASFPPEKAMTPGEFVAFFTAMGMLFGPMRALTSLNTPLQRGMAAADTLFSLLDEPVEEPGGRWPERPFQGEIRLEDLWFAYAPEQGPVLCGLSERIAPGETVALVGASGSGKSTLIQLIARFYDPTRGRICFDGEDIAPLHRAWVREQIAYVDQDVFLFDDSVAANVAFGDPEGIDRDRVRAALRQAQALDFVDTLEGGLDAPVGQGGGNLSGGQRQRLALARAFYKDAPLLILDEATSALDNASERALQKALDELCQGRTTLIIAHRLSTIERADRILVLDGGRIVESGSHQSLLEKGGLYRNLYRELS